MMLSQYQITQSLRVMTHRMASIARKPHHTFASLLRNAPRKVRKRRRSTAITATKETQGLFRLLGDAERELLAEQRLLTEQSVGLLLIDACVGMVPSKYTPHFSIFYFLRTQRSVARRVGLPPTRDETKDFFRSTFVIVVAGEYNSGKSTLINALLGSKLLPTGSLPTTDAITIISHDDGNPMDPRGGGGDVDSPPPTPDQLGGFGDIVHHRVSLPSLQDMTIVDTPGTNAVVTDHTAMTLRILPSADWILFCTSADRPMSESERSLLTSIAASYRSHILVVVNKMDVLDDTGGDHGRAEKERVVQFVAEHASAALGARPMILPISARDALAAKITGRAYRTAPGAAPVETSVWQRSNFASLERFLQETLTTQAKIQAKLSSPIGVAEGLLQQCLQRIQSESDGLQTDVMTLNLLNTQLTAWRKELTADMLRATNEILSLLLREGQRASVLMGRIEWKDFYTSCVVDAELLRREWDKTKPPILTPSLEHHISVKEQILFAVQEMATSVALVGRAQGQAMIEYLGQRPALRNQSLLGSVTSASQYEETRRNLQEHLTAVVNQHVDLNEIQLQEDLLHRWQRLVWCSAVANAGIVGLAAAVAVQLVDILSGVLSCGVLGTCNAFVWHVGRQQVLDHYSSVWTTCSQRLDDDVQIICSKEIDRVCRRIGDGVAPYTHFVEAENERLLQLSDECNGLMAKARQLRKKITNIH
jgi:small GTP-binding protein